MLIDVPPKHDPDADEEMGLSEKTEVMSPQPETPLLAPDKFSDPYDEQVLEARISRVPAFIFVGIWISLSISVIVFNKWILDNANFRT